MSMAHFDNMCNLFKNVKGGIQVAELVLEDCSVRASLFFHIINENTHSLILKNVRIAEGNLSSLLGGQPTPKTPAFWEDILPIFIHQARLTYCHLEDLKDYSSSQTINDSKVILFHSESNLAIKKGLKALFWNLCWRSWCSDPVEHSLTERYRQSRSLPSPYYLRINFGERRVAASPLPNQSASQSSPTPARGRR
jgi:hypothetical protein